MDDRIQRRVRLSIRGMGGLVGFGLHQVDLDLQRRVGQAAQDLGFGDDLERHQIEQRDAQRTDVLRECAVLGHDKYIFTFQHRLLEPAGSDPDFTRGTLEGDIAPSDITFYRLQCDSEGTLRAYIAQGEVLPVATRSFGGIGIFAIKEMGRFYRHVLVQKRYPHHGAVAFGHYGKLMFEVFKYLGVADIAYNQPKCLPYPTENPWA